MIARKKSLAQYCREKALRTPKDARNAQSALPAGSTLQRRAGPNWAKRTPLNRQSAKAKALVTPRKKCIAAVRARSGNRCEVRIATICTGWHDHTHEIKARSAGGSITDPANCLAVCYPCHRWIDEHANAARELGFIAPRGA